MGTNSDYGVIMIAGIMQRAGTNFLEDLLAIHPGCVKSFASEDFFLRRADLLGEYAKATSVSWNPRWLVRRIDGRALLMQSIGAGLERFLRIRVDEEPEGEAHVLDELVPPDKRIITKTPEVQHLELFHILFPNSPLLIIVRDGRSAVESAVRTFKWTFDQAVRRWRSGAVAIANFDERFRGKRRYLIVRYEELFEDPERQMRQILDFVGLSLDDYDFERARSLPVRGSSSQDRSAGNPWRNPVERTSSFDPLSRHAGWSDARRARFAWLAGRASRGLGYDDDGSARAEIRWLPLNVAGDVRYGLEAALRGCAKLFTGRT